MTSMDFEMAHSNIATSSYYDPNRNDKQVRGYKQGIRTITEFAVQNSDTRNTDDEFAAQVDTGGLSTAVVTTDALTRSSDQLIQLDSSQLTTLRETNFSGVIGPGALGSTQQRHEFDVPEDAIRITASLSWATNTQDNDFFLEDPDGERIAGSTNFGGPEQLSTSVESGGTYTYVVETFANVAANYEIEGEVQGVSDDTDVSTTGGDGGGGGGSDLTFVDANTSVSRGDGTLALDGGDATTVSVPQDGHTLSLSLDGDGPFVADLRSPSGETVRTYDAAAGPMVDGPGVDWVIRAPETGTWTVGAAPRTVAVDGAEETATGESVTFQTSTVETEDRTLAPSPEVVLGYEQFDYKVSPLVFFDSDFFHDDDPIRSLSEDRDFDDFTDAPVDTLSVADVAAGAHHGYDNLVVVHDDGADDDAYVGQLDAYVEDGGNLVVTDSGVDLLGAMNSDPTSGIGPGDTAEETYYVAHLGDKNADHPLLEDARPLQNQLWKVAGLGYSVGTEAPMTLVDRDAFEDAGGIAAGVQREADAGGVQGDGEAEVTGVSAGTLVSDASAAEGRSTAELVRSDIGSVHFVGGLFPPASQENLHPFGVLDYSASFLGYLMLTNALGYVQERSIGGETTADFGGEATF